MIPISQEQKVAELTRDLVLMQTIRLLSSSGQMDMLG